MTRKIALILLAVFLGLLIYRLSTEPLLINISTGPMPGDFHYRVFNPLRNREPERVADAFLERIKSGECVLALEPLPQEWKEKNQLCSQEEQYPLLTWRLNERTEESGKVALQYWYRRENYNWGDERMWVYLEQRGNDWQVKGYGVIY